MTQSRTLQRMFLAAFALFTVALFALPLRQTAAETTPEERGLYNLTHKAYDTPRFNRMLLEMVSRAWEPEWKAKINPNDPDSKLKIAFERYGFSPATWDNKGGPLQFLVNDKGMWVQTCMLCHGGRLPISGESKIGMPNTELDMQTLYEDATKATGLKGPFTLTFGQSRGRTNAFIFSLELLRRRNEDLSQRKDPVPMGDYADFDIDPPAWWYLKKKTAIYADGGVKGDFSRAIMQFTMGEPDGAKIRSWEPDFKDILAYLKSIEAPKYPLPIDAKLAAAGQQVFTKTCSGCHGTYGADGKYPNKIVPLEVVGTDSMRLTKLTKEFRDYYKKTWFGKSGEQGYEYPTGYVAPPLDGVWASAPYFHNGSVPTIYGVLTAEARPKYFRRIGSAKEYDSRDVGLKVEALSAPAPKDATGEARRRVIDTTIPGLSNQGHPFGFKLSEQEKRQVIEYLKTL
ncbi:MAG: c-type cytochrome [Acidobacteria bacterium]|nr:c-type cytochrome [Acidobacteriota bacterium]